ncbi:MAG: hypothetical protein E7774_03545 [Bradyrhizobium sp.]|nr:MAG: hypothetical protein E7774_03545 [Bradyrhizobium sp.]
MSVADFETVAKPIRLTPEQFQFVRALFVALPPMSRALPPGDHAIMAQADGQTLLALVGDDVSCARFLAPDFVLSMVMQVGQGATAQIGEPATFTIVR